MPELKGAEWVIVFATLLGPVLAVQAQKWIERAREKRKEAQGQALPFAPPSNIHSTTACTTNCLNMVAYHSRYFTDCIMYAPTSSSLGSTQK